MTTSARIARLCSTTTLGAALAMTMYVVPVATTGALPIAVKEDDDRIQIVTPHVEAAIAKKQFVTGVAPQSFVDRKTGFRELGYGLDIVDWLMEPGSDAAYRDQLKGDLPYNFNNTYHGKIAKRSIEGPQICTQAGTMVPQVIRGKDFVAITQGYNFHLSAPGKKGGSRWDQTIVFPADKRYFFSTDKITTVNASEDLFLRIDMPGHIKHKGGDSFSEIYLSYQGRIPAKEFVTDFAPDERFRYVRGETKEPQRFIRAYRTRDPKTGKDGPWIAGMTLEPGIVTDAWCHQRGYVCMIQKFGGRPIKVGESFSAAFIVGFFDSIEEMHEVYDRHAGNSGIEVSERGWRLTK